MCKAYFQVSTIRKFDRECPNDLIVGDKGPGIRNTGLSRILEDFRIVADLVSCKCTFTTGI
jgi:hypothetical protein